MAMAHGNVEEAEKLYNFLAGDLNIPDVTPPAPSVMQQVKESVGSLFGFVKENQNDIMQAYNLIQSIRTGTPMAANENIATGLSDLPPLSNVNNS